MKVKTIARSEEQMTRERPTDTMKVINPVTVRSTAHLRPPFRSIATSTQRSTPSKGPESIPAP